MEGWKEVKLKTLIKTMGDGGTPSTLDSANYGGDIPWVVVEDVEPEIFSTRDSLTEKGLSKCSAKMWEPETVILTTGATIGKVGVAKIPLCTKQGITGIVCNQFLHNYYLKYWLEANTNQLIRYSQGTTFKEIRTRSLGNLKIKVPKPYTKESISEQTAIAKILSMVDEAIRSTRETISKLERVKKSLMQNLLSGKMKPDGTLRPAAEFYEDDKMGLVPKGWKSVKLKEVVLRPGEYGANASAITYEEGKVRFIRITDINDDGTLSEDDKAGLDNEIAQKYLLTEDDFLFARTGDTIGKSLLYKESMGLAAFAGYLIKFTFDKQKIVPELFQLIANSEIFEAFKVSMKRVGAKPNINSREYGNFRFIMPEDIKSQKQIVSSFEPITKQITTNNKKITVLDLLKKSLMQQLLTGRVRVK